jgi:F420-dependent oxidoreductase-like protein
MRQSVRWRGKPEARLRHELGASFHAADARTALELLRHAEACGVAKVWLTTGAGPDALTIFAAAATCTERVALGTSIVPTFPRHPVVVAQQAADIAALAPGRFTLGLGPSHAPVMEGRYGIAYRRPLAHLREFVTIVTGLLSGQEVAFRGRQYQLTAKLNHGADVPVIVSALRPGSFELAGECAAGAVTWLCPARYLRDAALPALERGAERAGRSRPRLVGHAFLALGAGRDAVAAGAAQHLVHYPRYQNYQEMFALAGFPEARGGSWSEAMLDACVMSGGEEQCARQIEAFMQQSGCDEMILSVLPTGLDREQTVRDTLRWIGRL